MREDDRAPHRIYVPYRMIEVLYVTVAWRTVVDPVTALMSSLLGTPRALHLGFRDRLGVLQILHFKMNEDDTDSCYKEIVSRLEKR